MQLLKVNKPYSIWPIVRTLRIVVERQNNEDSKGVYLDFLAIIMKWGASEQYSVRLYRDDVYAVKTLTGTESHENVLVRDFLLDDTKVFPTEMDAMKYIENRLEEVFGDAAAQ